MASSGCRMRNLRQMSCVLSDLTTCTRWTNCSHICFQQTCFCLALHILSITKNIKQGVSDKYGACFFQLISKLHRFYLCLCTFYHFQYSECTWLWDVNKYNFVLLVITTIVYPSIILSYPCLVLVSSAKITYEYAWYKSWIYYYFLLCMMVFTFPFATQRNPLTQNFNYSLTLKYNASSSSRQNKNLSISSAVRDLWSQVEWKMLSENLSVCVTSIEPSHIRLTAKQHLVYLVLPSDLSDRWRYWSEQEKPSWLFELESFRYISICND